MLRIGLYQLCCLPDVSEGPGKSFRRKCAFSALFLRTPIHACSLVHGLRFFKMEYRGKHYTIVQGVGPDSWKWKVHLDEKTVKSGEARSRTAAMTNVVWVIDKAL